MSPKKTAAAFVVAAVAALAPTAAFADPTGVVQSDLTQLSNAVSTANTTLVADLSAITTAAQAGDRATVKSDIEKFRSDRKTVVPPIRADRKQLIADLKAARAGGVTGLAALVRQSVTADRAAILEIEQAGAQARTAVFALRHAGN